MTLSWIGATTLLLATLLAGCNSALQPSRFSVSVTEIRPTTATLLETQATMTLRYVNEDVTPVTLDGSTHKLYLNGSYVGRAVSDEKVELPALKTTTQSVTVYMENLSLIRRVQEMTRTQSQAINYRVESTLLIEAAGHHDRARATAAGELDLSAFNLPGLASPSGR